MNLIEGGERTIGIRPEHIRIVSQDGRAARVRSVEHLGADSIVLCELDGQAISVRQDGFSKAAPGDEIRLVWAPSDEHQFDSTSDERRAAATSEAKLFATG
jgi:sn-glycerol 3-phosphate transport system ATP-binding protein